MKRINYFIGLLTLSTVAVATGAAAAQASVHASRSASYGSSYAIDTRGDLWAWGSDSKSELGVGRIASRDAPARVENMSNVVAIAAGSSNNFAIRSDTSLWAWGANTWGQLGDGTSANRTTPVKIGTDFKAVSSSSTHTLALKTDGSLWAWGANFYGEIGDGSVAGRLNPVRIGDGYASIAAGNGASFAIKVDGTLWAWGNNKHGCVGDGTRVSRTVPTKIGANYASVGTSQNFRCVAVATQTDGSVWIWGEEEDDPGNSGSYIDLLGNATRADVLVPTRINSGVFTKYVVDTVGIFGLKSDSSVWSLRSTSSVVPRQIASGYSDIGNRGTGILTTGDLVEYRSSQSSTLQLGSGTPVTLGGGYKAVAAGFLHSLALKDDGSVWTWGSNQYGQLGVDQPLFRSIPTYVGEGYQSISTGMNLLNGTDVYAVKVDGSLWRWGAAGGNGAPEQIGTGYASVATSGSHVVALKTDGGIWTWGFNLYGQLGDGTTTDRTLSNPYFVGGGFRAIAATGSASIALRTDGSVWSWGVNSSGELGRVSSETCSALACSKVPGQVAALAGVKELSAAQSHVLALTFDGVLWSWGSNESGQLGDGNLTNSSVPIMVGSGFSQVSAGSPIVNKGASYAVKSDTTLWRWGASRWEASASSPVQIGTGFSSVALGGTHLLALKPDGTVWSWGSNRHGQLGDGTFGEQTTPQLVVDGNLSDFLDLDPGVPNTIPGASIPPFLVKASLEGTLTSSTLSADIRGIFQPLASTRAVPHGVSYKLYVVAAVGTGSGFAFFQLASNNLWGSLTSPLAEYLTGLALDTKTDSILIRILENADLSGIIGSQIFVGYGLDSDEMMRAGRFRKLMTVAQ